MHRNNIMSFGWVLTADMDGFAYLLFILDNEKIMKNEIY